MIGLHLLFEPAHFCLEIVDRLEGGQRGGVDRFAPAEIDVLIEQAELEAVDRMYLTFVSSLGTGDDAKQGRFSRAVSPDKADLFARIYLKRDAAKYLVTAERFCDIRNPK